MWLVDAFRGEKQDRFFALLRRQADALARAADSLCAYAETPSNAHADAATEAAADANVSFDDVIAALQDTFITPIDRQDIYTMSVMLADAADYFAGATTELRLFEVTASKGMREIADRLRQGAAAVRDAVINIEEAPMKSIASAREAMRIEDVVEDQYRHVLVDLFKREDARAILREREVYRHLSNSADRIDDIGRLIVKVAVKVG